MHIYVHMYTNHHAPPEVDGVDGVNWDALAIVTFQKRWHHLVCCSVLQCVAVCCSVSWDALIMVPFQKYWHH